MYDVVFALFLLSASIMVTTGLLGVGQMILFSRSRDAERTAGVFAISVAMVVLTFVGSLAASTFEAPPPACTDKAFRGPIRNEGVNCHSDAVMVLPSPDSPWVLCKCRG